MPARARPRSRNHRAPQRSTATPSPLAIEISGRTGAAHVPYLRRNLPRAHAILRPPLRELSLALVGNARMAELHEQFMNVPGPTDVLTFELDHDARGRVTAGEVVVCVPYALREAARRGVPPRDELLLYALHGMLHLCGYDDLTDRDFAKMHKREDEILTELGVGRVFAPMPTKVGTPATRRRAERRSGARA
jgi:probable rRNA maturation factor